MAAAVVAFPSVFHPGEQLVQERVGVRAQVKAAGLDNYIREYMPDQHRLFFEQQPLLYLSSRDAAGRPWATVLAGRPGFLSTPDPEHLIVNSISLSPQDPLINSLVPGAQLGMLGLELHTRRRNRLNGIIASVSAPAASGAAPGARLSIDVSLSFGNCPKYIQGRHLDIDWEALEQSTNNNNTATNAITAEADHGAGQRVTRGGALLGPDQERIVRQADTFFIATCYDGPAPADIKGTAVGCDVSHRGGPRGFLQVSQQRGVGNAAHLDRQAGCSTEHQDRSQQDGGSDCAGGGGADLEHTVLRWADYKGNNMFQTLGNLMLNPKAGLLILDFETGDTLHMTGEAVVDFNDTSLPGALRTASFHLHSFVHIRRAVPLRQVGAIDWSPFLPAGHDISTGHAGPGGVHSGEGSSSSGNKAAVDAGSNAAAAHAEVLECLSVVDETHDVKTFEFRLPARADQRAAYLPGQFATFEFPTATFDDAAGGPVVRTWTVSSHPSWTARTGTFTISVKRAGLVSSFLHDTMQPGSRVTFRAFGGDFVPGLLPPVQTPVPGSHGAAAAPSSGSGGSVLLVAGGIGITPLRAMMHDFLINASTAQSHALPTPAHTPASTLGIPQGTSPPSDSSVQAQAYQPINRLVLFYSIRGVQDAAFVQELSAAAEAVNKTAREACGAFRAQLVVAVSQGSAEELKAAKELWPHVEVHGGRITAQLLLRHAGPPEVADLKGSVRAAFMCGPGGFMATAEQLLMSVGLDGTRLFSESFSF